MAPRASPKNTLRTVSALGVVAPSPIEIASPVFEGSLAALFACARERKIDLTRLALAPICEAYFAYVTGREALDLDESASALAALAYLLERKAWLLLPSAEPEPEPDEAPLAIEPTVGEYRAVVAALAMASAERESLFFRTGAPRERGGPEFEMPFLLGEVEAADLARALERILLRSSLPPVETPSRPRRSLIEEMRALLGRVGELWHPLGALFGGAASREEAVYRFLAMLELMRLGRLRIRRADEDLEIARA